APHEHDADRCRRHDGADQRRADPSGVAHAERADADRQHGSAAGGYRLVPLHHHRWILGGHRLARCARGQPGAGATRAGTTLGGTELDATVPRIPISRRAAIVLDPPVSGGTWLASEGCCSDDTHHRRGVAPVNGELLVPQRFAIDWFAVDDQHRTWIGDPAVVSSYLSYGRRVIAAAGGTVGDSPDGRPPHPAPAGASACPPDRGYGREPCDDQGPARAVPPLRTPPPSLGTGAHRSTGSPRPDSRADRQQRKLDHAAPALPGPDHA